MLLIGHLDITKQRILKWLFYRQNINFINWADKIIWANPKHIDESMFTPFFEGKKEIMLYTIDENNLVITDKEIKKGWRN